MWSAIGSLIVALFQNPHAFAVLALVYQDAARAYRNLSPQTKAKVESVVRWGVEQAARFALSSVLDEVGVRVIDQIGNKDVAEFAKTVVKRGVEIGVDAALKEARGK